MFCLCVCIHTIIQKFGVSTFIKRKVNVEAYSFSKFFNDLRIQKNTVSLK